MKCKVRGSDKISRRMGSNYCSDCSDFVGVENPASTHCEKCRSEDVYTRRCNGWTQVFCGHCLYKGLVKRPLTRGAEVGEGLYTHDGGLSREIPKTIEFNGKTFEVQTDPAPNTPSCLCNLIGVGEKLDVQVICPDCKQAFMLQAEVYNYRAVEGVEDGE